MKLRKNIGIIMVCLIGLTAFTTGCKENSRFNPVNQPQENDSSMTDKNGGGEQSLPDDTKVSFSFNGKGMTMNIYVDAPSNPLGIPYLDWYNQLESIYNPFSDMYLSSDKREKQAYHRSVEKKYNMVIQYVSCFDSSHNVLENYKEQYVETINDLEDHFLLRQDIYAVVSMFSINDRSLKENYVLTGKYKEKDVLSELYFSLYDIQNHAGIMKEMDIVPVDIKRNLSEYYQNVYRYIPQEVYTDLFLYYDKQFFEENHLSDPQKMYFEGNWNWDVFYQLCLEIQQLDKNLALGIDDYVPFVFGLASANGINIVENNTINIGSKPMLSIYDQVQQLVGKGLLATRSSGVFSSHMFAQRDFSDLSSTSLTEKLALVPYPTSSNNQYQVSVYNAPGFSILNFDTLENGFTPEIAFRILYELESGYRLISSQTDEERLSDILRYFLDEKSIQLYFKLQEKQVYERMGVIANVSAFVQGCTFFPDLSGAGYTPFIKEYVEKEKPFATEEEKRNYVNQAINSLGNGQERNIVELFQVIHDYLYGEIKP
ncbi:MAG: hypothetical protein NC182_02255 [Prevotella sp.]|nr:hypothetical protein [Staphylococcus sp.]MCM1350006.1 hypothetical protein [Prevotella sp.]